MIGSDLETLEIVLLVLSLWSWNSVLQSLNKRKYPGLIQYIENPNPLVVMRMS